MTDCIEALARDESDVAAARGAVWKALDSEGGFRQAYAALCRWTWRAMIERRLDEDLKAWHRLLLDIAGRMAAAVPPQDRSPGRTNLDWAAAAERVRALADLVRLSIEAAAASLPKDLAARSHVMEIIRLLVRHEGRALERGTIKAALGLRDANLSRVLTLLAANGLVDRTARGKSAAFAITKQGASLAATMADEGRATGYIRPPMTEQPAKGLRSHDDGRVTVFARNVIIGPQLGHVPAGPAVRGVEADDQGHQSVYLGGMDYHPTKPGLRFTPRMPHSREQV